MKQILILIMLLFLLTGCGVHDKKSIVLKCIDGKTYIDVYSARLVTKDEYIKYPVNLQLSNVLYLDENDKPMKCIEGMKMKIEVGKKYINAEGEVIKIINNNEVNHPFILIGEGLTSNFYASYSEEGKNKWDLEDWEFDLICLVDETLYEQYQQSLLTKKQFIQKHIELYTGTKL